MKALCTVLVCLLWIATAGAAGGVGMPASGHGGNSLDQQWGPDLFGYRAKDSFEPDGPDFQWFDITGSGTQVAGLIDDNFVGPFAIGWDFRYYWYDVTQFWVGSNGYIKFSTAGQLASPFSAFPSDTLPNDVLGCYVADWFFGGAEPSACYYWSNNTDTLIVSWINVRAWNQNGNVGNHNFQLILSGVDSSITYMYGTSTTNDVYNNNLIVGIENLTGQIGLTFRNGQYPPQNYAVKVDYPDVVTYQVHDLAMAGVQNPQFGGFFLLVGDTLTPWWAVRNAGNQGEAAWTTNYSVRQVTNNALIAQVDTAMGPITPGESVEIEGPPLWTPTQAATYRVQGYAALPGDMNRSNDTVKVELHTLTLPGELYYDDGTNERDWSWAGGNGGMAMQFVPPAYPVEITQLRFFIVSSTGSGYEAQILDDNGEGGAPGDVMWNQVINSPAGQSWSVVEVPEGQVTITEGSFYVAWQQTGASISFGLDNSTNVGISRRAWEYTGGWAESRLSQSSECMIRVSLREPPAVNNPPGPFVLVAPADDDTLDEATTVTLTWTRSFDPDQDPVTYLVRFWSDNYPYVEDSTYAVTDTFFVPEIPIPTEPVATWFSFDWMVRATDGEDTTAALNGPRTFHMDITMDAGEPGVLTVRDYSLSASPNPFNPATRISFDLPQAARVELKVYNLVGEEVATLAAGSYAPGRYQVSWDAAAQPSGTYFAVLRTPAATRVHKLLLLK